jgi:hypothetical protein
MNATQRVAMRVDERRRPVERVVEVLRADERVGAAALTSSDARRAAPPPARTGSQTRWPPRCHYPRENSIL